MRFTPRARRWLRAGVVTVATMVAAALATTFWLLPAMSGALPLGTATAAPDPTGETSPATAPSGTSTGAPSAPVQVVGLGDSVMAGTNCGCDGIAAEFAAALAARDRVSARAVNLGVGGYVTGDVLNDLKNDARTRRAVSRADVVLVIIGANDMYDALDNWKSGGCSRACYTPVVTAMKSRLRSILAEIAALEGPRPHTVLVDGYWNIFTDGQVALHQGGWSQLSWSRTVTSAVNDAIQDAAAEASDTFVGLRSVFTDVPDPLLASDGDHPNAAGVRAIVKANLAALPSR
jgi:lysophospholipase L1-like esterase